MAEPTAPTDAATDRPAAPSPEGADRSGDAAVTGAYELLRDRLAGHAATLGARASALNDTRVGLFGTSDLALAGAERIPTEHPCVSADLVAVAGLLLFGFNSARQLAANTTVEDVFSLHRAEVDEAGTYSFGHVSSEDPANFLTDSRFRADFAELYRIYRDARLIDLRHAQGRLLAVFQTGPAATDIRVLRFDVRVDGTVTYVGDRGSKDYDFPPRYDFEWRPAGRDRHVDGRWPHINVDDEVYLSTTGGQLELRIDDGTELGRSIFAEPVEEAYQSLADAHIATARLGTLILLRVRPYREERDRYLVFNARTRTATRIDAIGQSCQTLPEDHGIIFPGGYYLQSGDARSFDVPGDSFDFETAVASPNGEDVLYHFHRRDTGRSVLLAYNLVRREVAAPMVADGVSLFDDGTLVLLRDPSGEATRVHQLQIWHTPFCSEVHHAAQPVPDSYLARIGNAELVRGISDALAIRALADASTPSARVYEDLIAAAQRAADDYPWYHHVDAGGLGDALVEVRATATAIVDEFDKVTAARDRAAAELDAAADTVRGVVAGAAGDLDGIAGFSAALAALRSMRGRLGTLRETRYIDIAAVDALDTQVADAFAALSARTVDFLAGDGAFAPFEAAVAELSASAQAADRAAALEPVTGELDRLTGELEVLSEVVAGLDVDDVTVRTSILESISATFAAINQAKATLDARRRELTRAESSAAFAAEFALFAQSVTAALAASTTPDRCDEQLGRLMATLETLESNYGTDPEYLAQVTTKREEVYEALTARKQALVDERAAKAARLAGAARRVLDGVTRRALGFDDPAELAGFFAADPMVARVRAISAELRGLGEAVAADELDGALTTARTDAARALRDRADLLEGGGTVIRLGRHRFSVNDAPVELTMVPSEDGMDLLVTGTDFRMPVTDPDFAATREFWSQLLVSETDDVYRAEYLAHLVLSAADAAGTVGELAAADGDELLATVRATAEGRYDEGYERGVHDHDAARIVAAVAPVWAAAGLARYPGWARTLAAQWFAADQVDDATHEAFAARAAAVASLEATFGPGAGARDQLVAAIATSMIETVDVDAAAAHVAADYATRELADSSGRLVVTAEAADAYDAFCRHAGDGTGGPFAAALAALAARPADARALARAALAAFAAGGHIDPAVVDEAAGLALVPGDRRRVDVPLAVTVTDLLGQHPRIRDRSLRLRLDEFQDRLERHATIRVPGYRAYQAARHRVLVAARARLRLDDYVPEVMSAFVRNQLINDVYLPLIGDNLAKQIGTVGEGRRTDQMGLLLLISPPGYGKTTLMEYVAARLGMVFVKVSGPALGHDVTSLDPADAPNATARAEVERINFALEAGNNVCLYLDDIQHTNPELLQKFISVADGTRRAEGVWAGKPRTWDLRGKRFAICMAGNPYTESGEAFQVPDMLANRADTYNLGDVIGGHRDAFALSYIENSLTSNPTLAPLAARDRADLVKLVRMADGETVPADELSHPYDKGELADIVAVLRHMRRVQQVLLAVNETYIASAAQDDAYRTEPPFGLQGSYRNMNKLAEKIVPVMNAAELETLLDAHYAGEAQTLTTGAEANLLKLAELRGTMTDTQAQRWADICAGFRRRQVAGDADDPMERVAAQIALLTESVSTGRRDESRIADAISELTTALLVAGAGPLAADRPDDGTVADPAEGTGLGGPAG